MNTDVSTNLKLSVPERRRSEERARDDTAICVVAVFELDGLARIVQLLNARVIVEAEKEVFGLATDNRRRAYDTDSLSAVGR